MSYFDIAKMPITSALATFVFQRRLRAAARAFGVLSLGIDQMGPNNANSLLVVTTRQTSAFAAASKAHRAVLESSEVLRATFSTGSVTDSAEETLEVISGLLASNCQPMLDATVSRGSASERCHQAAVMYEDAASRVSGATRGFALAFAIVGMACAALYWEWNRFHFRMALAAISRESLAKIDQPYSTEVYQKKLRPSQCQSFIDRPFKLIHLATTPPPRLTPSSTVAACLDEAIDAVFDDSDRPPLLIISGRIGTGLGYVSAHFVGTQVERCGLFEPRSWPFTYDGPTVFFVDHKDVAPLEGSQDVDKVRNAVEHRLELAKIASDDWPAAMEGCIVWVNLSPSQQDERLAYAATEFVAGLSGTAIANPSLDRLEMWNYPTTVDALELRLMPYASEQIPTAMEVALKKAASNEKRSRLLDELGGAAVLSESLCNDPLAVTMVGTNWRLALPFAASWLDQLQDGALVPSANAGTVEAARKALSESVRSYAEWVVGFMPDARGAKQYDPTDIELIIRACLDEIAAQRIMTDARFAELPVVRGWIESSIRAGTYGATTLATLRTYIKGAPFFAFDQHGRLSWELWSSEALPLLR